MASTATGKTSAAAQTAPNSEPYQATATTGLVWQTPPAAETHRSGSNQYQAEAAELRAHPGEWAVLKEFTGDGSGARSSAWRLASRVKKAEIPAFAPAGTFEAVTRTNGHAKVFVRFVGDQAAAAEAPKDAK
jgi:hypothetical protein